MPPSIAATSFYGDDRTTLQTIERIRISRLIQKTPEESFTKKKSKSKSKSPNVRSRYTGVKLFSSVSHGIKKPKPKPKLKNILQSTKKKKLIEPYISVRQKMKNKFDFSRTPYAISIKKPRMALNEESSKKRKFFKTTLVTPEQKKSKLDDIMTSLEFEGINEIEDESFAKIKNDVSNIIHHVDWFDDEICMRPQITRQKADDLANNVPSPNMSYITLTNVSQFLNDDIPTDTVNNEIFVTPADSEALKSNSKSISPKSKMLIENFMNTRTNVVDAENTPKQRKIFPLFNSPSPKNILSDVTNKLKKRKVSLDKAAASNDQYQIDAGQKVIGPAECSKCKMVYDIGDPFDKMRHDQYHANRNELKYKHTKTENVVGYCGTDRIIRINHSEEKKRKIVINVLKLTEEEIGNGYSFQSFSVAYLYIRHESILGCLIAESNVEASRVIKSEGIVLLSEEWQQVKCGINRIWVKPEFRSRQIATELMNCLRKNFRYGEYLEINDIAFSATTPDGHAFAKKYTKRDDYLTYLGSNMKKNF